MVHNYVMKTSQHPFADLLADLNSEDETNSVNLALIGVRVAPEYKERYEQLQKRYKRKFSRKVSMALCRFIDSAESEAS